MASSHKRRLSDGESVFQELEDISDSLAYISGEGGVPGVVNELRRLSGTLAVAVGGAGASKGGKRTLTEQVSRLTDVLTTSVADSRDRGAATVYRYFYVRSEPGTGRITAMTPTVMVHGCQAAELGAEWRLEELEVPRVDNDAEFWLVLASDKASKLHHVGAFNSHARAMAVCQDAWRQAHAESTTAAPAWVKRSPGKGGVAPLRPTPAFVGKIASLVIVPPALSDDAETFAVK